MSDDKLIIECDSEEIAAAQAWHGGQSSMLYAVASTGALSLGTIRPRERTGASPSDPHALHYRDLSDLEWRRSLVEKLEGEADDAADDALTRAAEESDPDELIEHAEALESLADKCRAWLDANPETQS